MQRRVEFSRCLSCSRPQTLTPKSIAANMACSRSFLVSSSTLRTIQCDLLAFTYIAYICTVCTPCMSNFPDQNPPQDALPPASSTVRTYCTMRLQVARCTHKDREGDCIWISQSVALTVVNAQPPCCLIIYLLLMSGLCMSWKQSVGSADL